MKSLADHRIETVLRIIYDEMACEPVPDTILALLRRLDDAEERSRTEKLDHL